MTVHVRVSDISSKQLMFDLLLSGLGSKATHMILSLARWADAWIPRLSGIQESRIGGRIFGSLSQAWAESKSRKSHVFKTLRHIHH